MKEDLLDIKEAAAYLSMNEKSVRKLVEDKKIPALKTGDIWKFRKASLHDILSYQMKSLKSEELMHMEIDHEKKSIEIHSLFNEKHVILNLIGNTKSLVLDELATLFAKLKGKEKKASLLTSVRDREKLCTTAISEGIAIPHPRKALKNFVRKPTIIFGRSTIGVDFESLDGSPTYLFFLICAPRDDVHLKIMARLSRLLRNYEFRKELMTIKDKKDVAAIVKKYEEKDKKIFKFKY
ncbi:PTS sugar transporter subunit IIA [Candidatus Auribacterota bacterium]